MGPPLRTPPWGGAGRRCSGFLAFKMYKIPFNTDLQLSTQREATRELERPRHWSRWSRRGSWGATGLGMAPGMDFRPQGNTVIKDGCSVVGVSPQETAWPLADGWPDARRPWQVPFLPESGRLPCPGQGAKCPRYFCSLLSSRKSQAGKGQGLLSEALPNSPNNCNCM